MSLSIFISIFSRSPLSFASDVFVLININFHYSLDITFEIHKIASLYLGANTERGSCFELKSYKLRIRTVRPAVGDKNKKLNPQFLSNFECKLCG